MSNYLILLPPSEGKVSGGNNKIYLEVFENKFKNSFLELNDLRKKVFEKISNYIPDLDEKQLEKIFDVKGERLVKEVENTLNIFECETMHSIERFSGVMFKAIDYDSLDENQKENFDERVVFIDGLFGLLKSKDLIPNYKLKIGAKVGDFNLTKFWKENLEDVFQDLFQDKLVVDILPTAHQKVLSFPKNCKVLNITFCKIKNEKLVNVGHDSKRLKGDLIRYLVEKDNLEREDLEKFLHGDGFVYSKEFSNENNIVYLKN